MGAFYVDEIDTWCIVLLKVLYASVCLSVQIKFMILYCLCIAAVYVSVSVPTCNFVPSVQVAGAKNKAKYSIYIPCKWQLESTRITWNVTQTQRKLWSSGRALGSQSEDRGFDPSPMLDGSGVKAMPGSISTPNSGSL